MPTDHRDLVLRARDGDRTAFAALVDRSIDRWYAVARLIVRDDHRAEDAVQDALLRAWLGIRALREPDRFDAWAHRLVVHACYTAARRERSRRLIEIQVMALDGPASADSESSLATRDQLERGFRRLSPEQRAVLAVHYYLDLPDAQAAEVLDVPIGTMKSRLNRATAALRAALAADDRAPALAEGRTA